VPTPTFDPASVPLLTWAQLKGATYILPENWGGPPDGLLPMEDGSFTYAYVPGAASVENYLLYRGVAFGDIDGDRVQDAVVVIIHSPAGTGVFYHLAAVLNDHGQPQAVRPAFLGDRIILDQVRVADGEIDLAFKTYRDDEPYGSTPTLQVAQRYRLREGGLELVSSETLNADQVVHDTPEREAVPIVLRQDALSVSYEGKTHPFGLDSYTLQALAGQSVSVTVSSPNDDAFLSIIGLEQRQILVRGIEELSTWSGVIPSTQEYAINVFAISLETEYTLDVEFQALPMTPTPAPAPATEEPETLRVVYLTFDDGPTPPYTREILELLQRYDARVTFFILGRHAERFPELLDAAGQAGHALGNHTYSHRSLVGISQRDFDAELQATEALLGEYAVPIMRPPYGATDAFTRPYAAELGYSVTLWNIDTLDWKQPPSEEIADTVLNQTYDGAIVLMHDGGGDREHTVAALEAVLQQLRAEGYTFLPVGRDH
jgi:peptidoglycan/xylan/chitin deacetylase (PgdA/CDA1 family)